MAHEQPSPGGRLVGAFAGEIARYAPWALPFRRMITRDVVAIEHPRRVSAGHLLLLPRNRLRGLDGASRDVAATVEAMRDAAQALVVTAFGNSPNVITFINGGARQDVRLLHVHILADAAIAGALREAEDARLPAEGPFHSTGASMQEVHLLIAAGEEAAVVAVQQRAAQPNLRDAGYSLMARAAVPAWCHLVASPPEMPAL